MNGLERKTSISLESNNWVTLQTNNYKLIQSAATHLHAKPLNITHLTVCFQLSLFNIQCGTPSEFCIVAEEALDHGLAISKFLTPTKLLIFCGLPYTYIQMVQTEWQIVLATEQTALKSDLPRHASPKSLDRSLIRYSKFRPQLYIHVITWVKNKIVFVSPYTTDPKKQALP